MALYLRNLQVANSILVEDPIMCNARENLEESKPFTILNPIVLGARVAKLGLRRRT